MSDDVLFVFLSEPELENPVFIEGLPGVGNVGKLAAEHLIDELKAEKFAEIYSKYFPPQVYVNDDGTIKMVKNELYCVKKRKKTKNDLIILVGDYQGISGEGQFILSKRILDEITKRYEIEHIFTLGGYGLGKVIEKPRVLGAATSKDIVKKVSEYGVVFARGEPGSGIIGASGLLLGFGLLKSIPSLCLMGETSGYFVDPLSAKAVLDILCRLLNIEIDYTELDVKALQMEKIAAQFKEMEKSLVEAEKEREDDLKYIG